MKDGTSCPKCGVTDRLKPRWFGVPRNLFILKGRIRAKGAAGGSHRVYGWSIERSYYNTMFTRSRRHVDRIVCPHPWHELPVGDRVYEGVVYPVKDAAEKRRKMIEKRRRGDRRGWRS